MKISGSELQLSATDLSNFLGCRHRTGLDMAVARGAKGRPRTFDDPLLDILIKRGEEHERLYVESLKASGRSVTNLRQYENDSDEHVGQTLEAMRRGADVIVQGALRDGRWFGKPDVLRRIETPSAFGDWSYEVIDTKLSKETKAGTILQLGLYSEMLGIVQELRPEYFYVVTPDKVTPQHQYRLDDFAAYFRLVRSQMLGVLDVDHDEITSTYYPDPVEHCDICRWEQQCKKKRRDDDHLSLVAGISRLQRRELESRDITTLAQLARHPLPLGFKPRRGSIETYVSVREQARLQLDSRGRDVPLFELREIVEKKDEGLCRLPEPSPGDIFLDLEGDPFAAEGGREYLFGIVTLKNDGTPEYQSFWGFTEHEERESFERVMDLIGEAWKKHPGMHVYHYAPYEPSAFKRLMGRYVTRERELDNMLRNGKFVDLYGVIRQGVRVGTERYSIKNLEPLYAFERSVRLLDANRCLRVMEQALELHAPETVPGEVRDAVEGYNMDDCVSTLRLRDWLEKVRGEHIAKGTDIPRPKPPEEKPEKLTDRDIRVRDLRARLLKDVPEDRLERNDEQQARWLLAYLLDYHRREDKAVWWEYYRLRELPEEDLFDEPQAIAGMSFVSRVGINRHATTGNPTGPVTDRYSFPAQEMEIERGDLKLKDGSTFGSVVTVDRPARTVDVLKGKKHAENHPTSAFSHTYIKPAVLEDSIYAIAERVTTEGGVASASTSSDAVGRALLLALPPRLASVKFGASASGDIVDDLKRTVLALDHSVLAVQGPPGAGKTFAGAEMICALVKEGKKVGIAATSHKVIRKLLEEVEKAAARNHQTIGLAHKADEDDFPAGVSKVVTLKGNDDVVEALASGTGQLVGGTSWLWARADLAGSVEVLFVDEAGQMSLANVLAMSPCARSIVLLGDPQQLEQPRKGSHPDGVSVSALEHMLVGHKTIPDGRGVFLPLTWRLCPAISAFTSELFYESRLRSKPGLERQLLNGAGDFDGSGLWVVKASHDGNRTSSMEEIDIVEGLVKQLVAKAASWTDKDGKQAQILGSDILIVAPYNAQVSRLTERLAPTGARVGTVDKFQGQEAPVVIYSMATSRPEDAPRGMEFLYSINRLNVATSRARCAAILVANDRLFEPECRTPRQMKLANALCRYRELARSGNFSVQARC
ncbi:MAG: TM0106 family RecB-like putative nuclease [Gemmatimonadaceae bacterium]